MMRWTRRYTLGLCMMLLLLGIGNGLAGTLGGKVTDEGGHSGIAEAVVWAEPQGEIPTFPVPAQHAEMAQINTAFVPRVLPVLVGTTVDFPNRDRVFHSVFSFSRQQRFEIGLYRPGQSRSVTFDTVGERKIFCNIHDRMYAYMLVLSTPYFSLTQTDGTFTIDAVPAGDYTVQVWHERLKGQPQTITLADDDTLALTFALRPQERPSRRRRRE